MRQALLDDIVVASVGPILTSALAFVVATLVTRKAQDRRANMELREELAAESTEIASSWYFALQTFRRTARDIPLKERSADQSLKATIERMDELYQQCKVRGQVLEHRLQIYFPSDDPSRAWHRVMDLLTVRYRLLTEWDPAKRRHICEVNAGKNHSGLNVEELQDPSLIVRVFPRALSIAVTSIWTNRISRSGRHILKGKLADWRESVTQARTPPPDEHNSK